MAEYADNADNSDNGVSVEDLAVAALDTIPLVMRAIRALMRAEAGTDLSLLQFRALGYINRNHNVSLTELATHLGISVPGASRLVQALVEHKMVRRIEDVNDRRRVVLTVLPAGEELRASARQRTQEGLMARLRTLTPEQRAALSLSLPALRDLFDDGTQATTPTAATVATEAPEPSPPE